MRGKTKFLKFSFKRSFTSKIRIHEVTPRDGLQNEKNILTTAKKLKLIEGIVSSGFKSIEVCSFVREDLVPQMAKSKDLCRELYKSEFFKINEDVSYSALVPNIKGYSAIKELNRESRENNGRNVIDTVCIITSCTESHSKANVGMSISDALLKNQEIVEKAKEDNVNIRAYASLAFGCPFEGLVSSSSVCKIVDKYLEFKVDKIGLADTYGHGEVNNILNVTEEVFCSCKVSKEDLCLHFHDANGKGVSNLLAVMMKFGITDIDSAIGGCGGCSFIEGAKGNVSTEAVLNMIRNKDLKLKLLNEVKEERLKDVHLFLEKELERKLQ